MTRTKKSPPTPAESPAHARFAVAPFAPGADPLVVWPHAVGAAPSALAGHTPEPPKYDPVAAAACLDALRPRLAAIAVDRVVVARLDVDAACRAVLVAVAWLTGEPALHARFQALARAGEVDAGNLDLAKSLAFAVMHASAEARDAGAFRTEAKVPPALDEESARVEREMQGVCEHNLLDHPVHGPTLALLSPGTSYEDRAADLLGYAKLYVAEHATISKDTRYKATHVADARRLAGEIHAALSLAMTPKAREQYDLLQRAFTLLVAVYGEIAEAGRFLLRADPRRDERFPSLFAVGRPGVGKRRGKKAGGEVAGPDGGAAPAGPVTPA
jgi:hypothetical protein